LAEAIYFLVFGVTVLFAIFLVIVLALRIFICAKQAICSFGAGWGLARMRMLRQART
jgi:hypothetical protein